MSYGVLASKNGQLMVEATAPGDGGATGAALAKLVDRLGRSWAAGRITVTRLNLSFLPATAARTAPTFTIALSDVESVEITGGRMTRVVGVVTATHTIRFKTSGAGAQAFAQAIATAAHDLRRDRRSTSRFAG